MNMNMSKMIFNAVFIPADCIMGWNVGSVYLSIDVALYGGRPELM